MLVETQTPLWTVEKHAFVCVLEVVLDDLVNPLVAREATLVFDESLHLRVVILAGGRHHIFHGMLVLNIGWLFLEFMWVSRDRLGDDLRDQVKLELEAEMEAALFVQHTLEGGVEVSRWHALGMCGASVSGFFVRCVD